MSGSVDGNHKNALKRLGGALVERARNVEAIIELQRQEKEAKMDHDEKKKHLASLLDAKSDKRIFHRGFMAFHEGTVKKESVPNARTLPLQCLGVLKEDKTLLETIAASADNNPEQIFERITKEIQAYVKDIKSCNTDEEKDKERVFMVSKVTSTTPAISSFSFFTKDEISQDIYDAFDGFVDSFATLEKSKQEVKKVKENDNRLDEEAIALFQESDIQNHEKYDDDHGIQAGGKIWNYKKIETNKQANTPNGALAKCKDEISGNQFEASGEELTVEIVEIINAKLPGLLNERKTDTQRSFKTTKKRKK